MQQSFIDSLINCKVLLPQGEATALAKVARRVVGSDGKVIGEFNENSILNSLVYQCEFNDGTIKEYAANVIAENIYAQADTDGH